MNANPAMDPYTTPPQSPRPLEPPKLPKRVTAVLQAPSGNVPAPTGHFAALCMLLEDMNNAPPAGAAGAGPVQPGPQAGAATFLDVLFPTTF